MNSKIQPQDIDASKHFFDAFDNMETEISARWIVKFCQSRGRGWEPFTRDEIERFHNEHGFVDFWFNKLGPENGVRFEGDIVHIEHEFVARCWKASPAQIEVA